MIRNLMVTKAKNENNCKSLNLESSYQNWYKQEYKKVNQCVATVQGLTGLWDSGRWKNIQGAVGMSDVPLLKGGWVMHAARCMVPLHITCPPMWPQQGVPTPLNARDKQSWQRANTGCITQSDSVHASPLKAMGTVDQTQSQGYENTTYQAHSRSWETASLSCPDTWVRKPDCLHLFALQAVSDLLWTLGLNWHA